MSWKSRSNGNRTNRVSRTGTSAPRGQTVPRWQDAGAASGRSRARSRSPISRWLITTLVGASLLVLLVALMLLREWRTQVIILTATDYSLPTPLNPWAVEDGNALKELEQENLTPVTDISDKWNAQPSLSTLLGLLEEEIEQTKAPLIVYISMHGIVNDERMPCLLPPGVGPGETTKLIPVRRILEHVSQLAANRRNALVILDCNRFRASWNLGIVYNTFTERLQEVLKANPVSNVAVLCSAGPGQVNWASADLQGSSFGRYLQLGLAGAADAGESADGNGAVELPELVTYLQREVNAWSEFNRGEPQRPALVSGEAEDFHVAYNVRDGDTLEGLVSKFYAQKRAEPEKRSEIAALWDQLERLRKQGLVRQDPLACRDFEFGLLRLEELWQGGSAYRQSAEDELILLKDKFARAVAQKEAVADSRSVSDHLALGTMSVAAHTLPMAEYFGACDAEESERIGQLWSDPTRLASDNAPSESAPDEPELEIDANDLAEMQLLLAAREQGVNSLWQSQDPLASALKLRDRAEQLAVPRGPRGLPGDERAHYFARHALNAADERRRLVEDALFIGPRSGQDFAELVTQAEELYDAASEVMHEATTAYAIRDTALAEAPYLGWWLCGPANLEVPDRKALINELIELIRQSRALNQAITSPGKLGEAGSSAESSGFPYQHLTSAALAHHQALKVAFQRKCEDLLGAGAQGTSGWTAFDSALTTPLIPANQRGEFLAKRDEVSEQLFTRYSETKQAAGDTPAGNNTEETNSTAGNDSSAPYLEVMQGWDSHPLVEILPGKNFEAAKLNLAWCDDVSKHVRGRLARLPSDEDDGAGATERAADDIFADRQRLSRAESDLRALASLGFGLGGFKVDPLIALREFDLRALLAWHGQRVMDDFWGDATGLDDPFFVSAAKHYFDAASSLGTPTPAFQPHIRGLQGRLAQLEKAKSEGVQLQATPKLVDEEKRDVDVQVEVSATRASYPAGQAAIYLRNEEPRQRLKIDPASAADTFLQYPTSEAKSYAIAIRSAPDQPQAEAVSFFRGQEVTDPFEMPTFRGVRIVYAPHKYDSQTITLSGDDPEQLSLVFILDCSFSMSAQSKVQAERPETLQRLVLAKNHLITMLSDIADRNAADDRTRVGIRFFGHRLGWSTTDQNPPPPGWTAKLLTNNKYRGRKPEKPHPAVDVEKVQPLGEFDDGVATDIATLLESVEPLGETPLYLALLLALDDFKSDNPLTRKSIIAITDGQDYQYEHQDFPPPVKITLARLRTEWEGRGDKKIPVHILGFDIAPKEAARAQTEYREVANFSGGSYTKIGSGRELLEHLRQHLNVDGYLVDALPLDSTNQSPPQPVKLGTTVPISNSPLPRREFEVRFRDVKKSVWLEGGEAIELHVEKKGVSPDIVAHNYNGRSPLPEETFLTNGAGGESEFILRAHLPVRRQGSENVVEFPISLQRDTSVSHFTDRPAEIWLEITPLSVDGSGKTKPQQPYVYYDTNFEPYEPVPVVVCPAMGWRDWPKAQIKFWCKYRPTKEALTIRLRDARYRTPQTVPEVKGVQIRVEPSKPSESGGVYRVYVAEKHSAESPGVSDALRIQFQTHPQCKPIRVRHQFDSAAGLVTHSFEFQESDRETIENYDGSQIVVTLASDIKAGALQLAADSAIEVLVQAAGGYHTTGAASNGQ